MLGAATGDEMGTGHSKHLGEILGLLLDTGGQVILLSGSDV